MLLQSRCRKLSEYARYVARVREDLERGLSLREAADEAIEYCIQEGVLSELLSLHRAEVRNMILEEYDEQSHMASERQEWREIGREEGREEGRQEGREEGRQEGREEGRQEGREEGHTIGISKGLAKAILELLDTLGEVSDNLSDRILQEENHDILIKWLKLASRSDTIAMFLERME